MDEQEKAKIRRWLEDAQMSLHEVNDPRERCRMEGRIEAYKKVLGEGTLKCLPGKGPISLKG
jgi:hypothetical protein